MVLGNKSIICEQKDGTKFLKVGETSHTETVDGIYWVVGKLICK